MLIIVEGPDTEVSSGFVNKLNDHYVYYYTRVISEFE